MPTAPKKTCITQLFIETKISNNNYRKQANRKRSRDDVFIISTRNFKIAGESKSSSAAHPAYKLQGP